LKTGKERMIEGFKDGSPDDIPNVIYYTNDQPSRGHFWKDIQGDIPYWIKVSSGLRDDPKFLGMIQVQEKITKALDLDWIWTNGICPSRDYRMTSFVVETKRGSYLVCIHPDARYDKQLLSRQIKIEELQYLNPIGPYSISMDLAKIKTEEIIPTNIDFYVGVKKAETLIDNGQLDWFEAVLDKLGDKYFIQLSGNSPLTQADSLMGSETFLRLIIKKPDLVHKILDAITRKTIEQYEAYHKILAGREGVGVWCWEWYTEEVMSPNQWKAFGVPYVSRLAKAAKQYGLKLTLSVDGAGAGWEEGVKHLVSTKPDGFRINEQEKSVKSDMEWQANLLKKWGYQKDITLLGSFPSRDFLAQASAKDLENQVKKHIEIGREYGKFIMNLGTLLGPEPTLKRMQEYSRLIRKYGRIK